MKILVLALIGVVLTACEPVRFTQNIDVNILEAPEEESTGVMLWKANATLRPIEGLNIPGGFLEVTVWNNKTFTPNIRLRLPRPDQGSYHAWLTNYDTYELVSLGELEEHAETQSYYLSDNSLVVDKKLQDFSSVLISHEGVNGTNDGKPILVGNLKVVDGILRGSH